MASRVDWILRVVVVSAVGLLVAAIVTESCRGRVKAPADRVPMTSTTALMASPDSIKQKEIDERTRHVPMDVVPGTPSNQ
jgi:hypothetical protein